MRTHYIVRDKNNDLVEVHISCWGEDAFYFKRSELIMSEEMFLTGTAAESTPVISMDSKKSPFIDNILSSDYLISPEFLLSEYFLISLYINNNQL